MKCITVTFCNLLIDNSDEEYNKDLFGNFLYGVCVRM